MTKRIFKYTRGSKYMVTVAYDPNDQTLTFHDVNVPDNIAKDLINEFLEEAEVHVNKILDEEMEQRFAGGH